MRAWWASAAAGALLAWAVVARGAGPAQPTAPGVVPPARLVDPEPQAPGGAPPIERPEALAGFFEALDRTAAGAPGAITRVVHLGDSSIGMDGLPHVLRGRFQGRYGDAGPGFVLLQPHSGDYLNRAASLSVAAPWDLCFIVRRCLRDGRYGLGGVSVDSPGGAESTIRPRDRRAVSRAELWYLAQPRGGRLAFHFGPGVAAEVDTRSERLEERWRELRRPAGAHTATVRALRGGRSRAFGVVLENDGPGVVWDTLSMIGAFTPRLLEHDAAHFAGQLQHRAPALIALNYGGNDLRRLTGGRATEAALTAETEQVLARVRGAVPAAGCLVVGINDHLRSGGAEVTAAHVSAIERAQRAAAARRGCAYWSTLDAMGGPGSFAEWARRGLAASDGKHLSPRGRQVIGHRLFAALEEARRARAD